MQSYVHPVVVCLHSCRSRIFVVRSQLLDAGLLLRLRTIPARVVFVGRMRVFVPSSDSPLVSPALSSVRFQDGGGATKELISTRMLNTRKLLVSSTALSKDVGCCCCDTVSLCDSVSLVVRRSPQ
jgi:hypothetical protein